MMLFRTCDNVPDPYVKKSRDFQLMCNSLDLIQNASKFDIDSILDISDTKRCPDTLLIHLQEKLGFFSSSNIASDQLRVVLESFPHIIKLKGTINGIVLAIRTFLMCHQKTNKSTVTVDNNNYAIYIGLQSPMRDISLLRDILSYVIPVGYTTTFRFYTQSTASSQRTTAVYSDNEVDVFITSESSAAAGDKYYRYKDSDSMVHTHITVEKVLENMPADVERSEDTTHAKYISNTASAHVAAYGGPESEA